MEVNGSSGRGQVVILQGGCTEESETAGERSIKSDLTAPLAASPSSHSGPQWQEGPGSSHAHRRPHCARKEKKTVYPVATEGTQIKMPVHYVS